MNSKIQRLIDVLGAAGINIDNAEIDAFSEIITFWQHRETRSNMRQLKRHEDGFKKEGEPPYVKLVKHIKIPYITDGEHEADSWKIKWEGAYTCKSLGHECNPAPFTDDTDPADNLTDEAVERDQIDRNVGGPTADDLSNKGTFG